MVLRYETNAGTSCTRDAALHPAAIRAPERGPTWSTVARPPPLRQDLLPILQPLSLREGQATLARIRRRATEVFPDLWDLYGEVIAPAQPLTGARL